VLGEPLGDLLVLDDALPEALRQDVPPQIQQAFESPA
jgi:hypothetical protein